MTAEYTPTQLLFDKIFSLLQGLGIEVIDVKDIANDIPYPFVIKNLKLLNLLIHLIVFMVL